MAPLGASSHFLNLILCGCGLVSSCSLKSSEPEHRFSKRLTVLSETLWPESAGYFIDGDLLRTFICH
jgi:hypothetical protein